MGNAHSESGSNMAGGARLRLPMPEPEELEKKFNKVLVSLSACHSLGRLGFMAGSNRASGIILKM